MDEVAVVEEVTTTVIDYTSQLTQINDSLLLATDLLYYVLGCLLFFVIVVICHYGYRFLKIFF